VPQDVAFRPQHRPQVVVEQPDLEQVRVDLAFDRRQRRLIGCCAHHEQDPNRGDERQDRETRHESQRLQRTQQQIEDWIQQSIEERHHLKRCSRALSICS
jgi:hypothetical protein